MASPTPYEFEADAPPIAGGRYPTPAWRQALTGGWSANLATNVYSTVLERTFSNSDFAAYYAAPGQDPAEVVVASNNAWAYSSGVYVGGDIQAYFMTGGGHNDWLGSEIGKFSLRTLTWVRTDDSAKLKLGENDPTAPLEPTEQFGWKAWRNDHGRYAPLSSHTYGGLTYLPSMRKIHVLSGAPYRSGVGNSGGTMGIDVDTGWWDESIANPNMNVGRAECVSHTLPSAIVVNSSLVPTGEVWEEPVLHVWAAGYHNTALVNPATKQRLRPVSYVGVAWQGKCHGCVIPDPDFEGRLAYVADRGTTTFAILNRVDVVRADGAAHSSAQSKSFGNTKPSPIGNGALTRWIYMGDYLPGNRKIAVYHPSAGLYALDTDGWIWSELIVPAPTASSAEVWKRFEYLPEFECFGLWGSTSFRALPLPIELR